MFINYVNQKRGMSEVCNNCVGTPKARDWSLKTQNFVLDYLSIVPCPAHITKKLINQTFLIFELKILVGQETNP